MAELSEAALDAAGAVLGSGVEEGLWPGVVASAGVGGAIQRRWVLGDAEHWSGGQRPMALDTVFDVASLTKVLVTLPAILLLVQGGTFALDESATTFLPALDPRITVRQLLCHTAGLPAHRRFDQQVSDAAGLIAAAAGEPLERSPGTQVVYSDLGFVLLGGIIQAVTGQSLPEFAAAEVFGPLGMHTATFAPPSDWLGRIASTELVDGRPVHGTVHDENAAAAGGGVGHAGLFASLADVEHSIGLWLPSENPLLRDWLRTEAVRDQTAGLGGNRGLGWTCRGDDYDILSDGWGARAVSHTGFTGTSLALDPATGRWTVLLTNAVHFGRGRPEVFAARRLFHRELASC
jgi:CubicO group peptidase (beta-lactamase class C family)